MRHGFSILWEPKALQQVISADKVQSIRQFLALMAAWPEELPGSDGNALVVAGLEGCLDVLASDDAVAWLETDLKDAILSFQERYQGDAALIMWVPSGPRRLVMSRSAEEYSWLMTPGKDESRVPLGRCLWGGAASDVSRIIFSNEKDPDLDGAAYAGLYHPRIS